MAPGPQSVAPRPMSPPNPAPVHSGDGDRVGPLDPGCVVALAVFSSRCGESQDKIIHLASVVAKAGGVSLDELRAHGLCNHVIEAEKVSDSDRRLGSAAGKLIRLNVVEGRVWRLKRGEGDEVTTVGPLLKVGLSGGGVAVPGVS